MLYQWSCTYLNKITGHRNNPDNGDDDGNDDDNNDYTII